MRRPDAHRLGQQIGTVLLVGGVGYLFAALAAVGEASARDVLLRYGFVAAGAFAVAPPHVLLPDAAVPWLQLLNPSPRALLLRQARPWGFVVAAFLVPPIVLALEVGTTERGTIEVGDVGWPLLEVLLVVLGVGVYAFEHYTGIGPVSQAWQEGARGERYRRLVAKDSRASLHISHGLVPTVLASARIFALSAAVILTSAWLANAGRTGVAWLPAAVLLGYSLLRLLRRVPQYDRDFYATNALYVEVLTAGGVRETMREPLRPESVYWAPRALRPYVWASLVQLDRRLPLGRLFALGVLGLFVLLARGAPGSVLAGTLLLGLGAKNAAVFCLAAPPLAPPAFDLALQSPAGWVATRALVNLRWTLPLALALGLAALVSDAVTALDLLLWSGVDVALALVTAWLATYAADLRYRRRFA